MERCRDWLLEEPALRRGCWKRDGRPLFLEIGCGKGSFTCALAAGEPSCDIVAIEKVPDAMILAMERAKAEGLDNVRFADFDAARLTEMFTEGETDRIYINFCDPWPKSRDAKFRLTAPSFLRRYASILPQGGEIRFRTDNLALFDWSERQFREERWELRDVMRDRYAGGVEGSLTDYERRFLAQGIAIKSLTAVRTAQTKDVTAGEPPRLRDAALPDARGIQDRQKLQGGTET